MGKRSQHGASGQTPYSIPSIKFSCVGSVASTPSIGYVKIFIPIRTKNLMLVFFFLECLWQYCLFLINFAFSKLVIYSLNFSFLQIEDYRHALYGSRPTGASYFSPEVFQLHLHHQIGMLFSIHMRTKLLVHIQGHFLC